MSAELAVKIATSWFKSTEHCYKKDLICQMFHHWPSWTERVFRSCVTVNVSLFKWTFYTATFRAWIPGRLHCIKFEYLRRRSSYRSYCRAVRWFEQVSGWSRRRWVCGGTATESKYLKTAYLNLPIPFLAPFCKQESVRRLRYKARHASSICD